MEKIPGTSPSRLNQAFRKGRALDNAVATQLLALRDELESLCREAAPLALDLSNSQVVHDLLTARREGRLRIAVSLAVSGDENSKQ